MTTRTLRRTVPTEGRVDIERCRHHRSQPHHQHRCRHGPTSLPLHEREWLAGSEQHVLTTRAATSACSSPPGISCPTCTPSSFSRARPPPWNPPTATQTLLAHVPLAEPLDEVGDPHSLPHMAGHDGHQPRWRQFSLDLLLEQECTVHVSQEFLAEHRLTHAQSRLVCDAPNTTAVRQPLDRAYMRPIPSASHRLR